MSVTSFTAAKLKDTLEKIAGKKVEWHDLADVEPNDYFEVARRACELSLYGIEATEALAQAWDELNLAQKMLAVFLAERVPSPQMVPHLEECVAPGAYAMLRSDAARALGAAPAELAIPILKRLCDDHDDMVREKALRGLAGMQAITDAGFVERHLHDSDAQVRTQAVHVLGGIEGDRATLLLMSALDDPQMGVALQAKRHLLKRREQRDLLPDMVARLQDFGKKGRYRLTYALEILAALKDQRCIEPLLEYLQVCRNAELKKQVAKILGRFKDPRVLPGLWQLGQDRDEKVQAAALNALARVPHADSLPTLRAVLARAEEREPHGLLYLSEPLAKAVAKIPGDASVALLFDCLVSKDYKIIEYAALAVSKKKLEPPVERLGARLRDEDSDFFRDKYRKIYLGLGVAERELDAAMAKEAPPVQTQTASAGEESDQSAECERLRAMSVEEIAQLVSMICTRHFSPVLRERLEGASTSFERTQQYELRRRAGELEGDNVVEMPVPNTPRHEELIQIIRKLHLRGKEVVDYADVIGDVLTHQRIDTFNCNEEMLQTLWDSGHPYRIPFALSWLGINVNRKQYGKIAFRCLKSVPEAGRNVALEAFLQPDTYRVGDQGQLALLLGHYKRTEAVVELARRLCDDRLREQERKCYAEALGMIGDERAIAPLTETVAAAFEGPFLRKVFEALARLRASQAIPAIEARHLRTPSLKTAREKTLTRLRG